MWCPWAFPTTTGRDCSSRSGQRTRFHVCTSLVPKPMTLVIGLRMRLDVHMRTRLKNGVLRNGQQPGSAGNSFFDYSEFEAMKSLSGWVAACCDEHQFRAKIKVNTWAVFKLSLFEQSRNEERRIRKMALLLPHTFVFSCLPCGFWATIWVLLITKTLKEEAWELK